MDARGVGTVTVELNHTLAELLAKLCIELETDDYTGVISRALGRKATLGADPIEPTLL
jgi:hypothetical protein